MCITQGAGLADAGDLFPDRARTGIEAVGKDERHHERHGQRTGKVTDKHQPPVAQHTAHGDARTLVQQRQWREHEYPSQQVETHQVQHREAHGEQHRTEQRGTALHRDGDRKHCGQSQNRPRHETANQGVAGRHVNFRFAGIEHLGDEFEWK
ncbi:hypothetical protein D3C84_995660 [compost metagenome]